MGGHRAGADYDHVTPDLPQTFKINGSKVKLVAWHDVLALKIVTFHERITSLSLNFVQTIAKHSATRDTGSRSYKVKYSNRNNSTADCLIAFKFGTEFDHGTASIVQTFTVTGQSSRSQRNAVADWVLKPARASFSWVSPVRFYEQGCCC